MQWNIKFIPSWDQSPEMRYPRIQKMPAVNIYDDMQQSLANALAYERGQEVDLRVTGISAALRASRALLPNTDDMRIRTPAELGALIRDHRKRLRLHQKSLAEKVDVSRQWIVDVEKGKPGAPIGLVLRTLNALGIAFDATTEGSEKPER